MPSDVRGNRFHIPQYLVILGVIVSGCGSQATAENECVALTFTTETTKSEMPIVFTDYKGNSIAQSFKLPASTDVNGVSLVLSKSGTVPDDVPVTLTIEEDQPGKPNGTVVTSATGAASGNLRPANISTPGAYRFNFTGYVTLDFNKTYWLRLTGAWGASNKTDANFIQWHAHDGVSGDYTDGRALYQTTDDPSGWSSYLVGAYRDLLFTIHCQQ